MDRLITKLHAHAHAQRASRRVDGGSLLQSAAVLPGAAPRDKGEKVESPALPCALRLLVREPFDTPACWYRRP
jgi:hypothetical protein